MENAKILTEAQIEAIENVAEAIRDVFDRLFAIIKKAAEQIAVVWRTIIENYHNKRVVHLALHHKDPTVRKKNTNRIMKWLRRWISCKE